MEKVEYSLKKGIAKAVKYFVLFALPALVDKFIVSYPEIAQLTVGGILVGLVNLLKIKFGKDIFALSLGKKRG